MPRQLLEDTPAEEPSPFDAFDSISEVCGFLYKLQGEEGLRECFDRLLARDEYRRFGPYREELEQIAVELATVGLNKAADIIAEYAANAPLEIETCPYEPGSANATQWYQSLMNRQSSAEMTRQRESVSLTPVRS